MGQTLRNLAFWAVLGLLFVVLYTALKGNNERSQDLSYSNFLRAVEKHEIDSVQIEDNVITGTFKARAEPFHTVSPKHEGLVDILRKNNVEITVKEPAKEPWYFVFFVQALPKVSRR